MTSPKRKERLIDLLRRKLREAPAAQASASADNPFVEKTSGVPLKRDPQKGMSRLDALLLGGRAAKNPSH